MEKHKSLVQRIYETSEKDLPGVAEKSIKDACTLLEQYAIKIAKKTDIISHRWILLNLLNVLYKDVFLLQTEDFNQIIESKPKELDPNLSERCYKCNANLKTPADLERIDDKEKIRGLCLNCFITTVQNGEWWNESWARLKEEI